MNQYSRCCRRVCCANINPMAVWALLFSCTIVSCLLSTQRVSHCSVWSKRMVWNYKYKLILKAVLLKAPPMVEIQYWWNVDLKSDYTHTLFLICTNIQCFIQVMSCWLTMFNVFKNVFMCRFLTKFHKQRARTGNACLGIKPCYRMLVWLSRRGTKYQQLRVLTVLQ